MSRIHLQQLNQAARQAVSNFSPVLGLSKLQATPTLLRGESRQWFGNSPLVRETWGRKGCLRLR